MFKWLLVLCYVETSQLICISNLLFVSEMAFVIVGVDLIIVLFMLLIYCVIVLLFMHHILKVWLSFRSFILLSGCFLGIISSAFSKFWHNARNPYEVVCNRARFSWKKILTPKLGKWTKNGPKKGFFEYIEKICH